MAHTQSTVNPELPALISIPAAARLLGLSRASAYRYAAAGELPTKRYGRRVYVIRARLADVLGDGSSAPWKGKEERTANEWEGTSAAQ
ncbi:MAG TPA: helix-turn-helix domain-containing protein [Pseudonocardiaceae bacterium]|nr:helix-turn-helix domain-containing protein [Pseudonocardiaceae bacterium]